MVKEESLWGEGGCGEHVETMCLARLCQPHKGESSTRPWPKPNGKGKIWKSKRETGLQRVGQLPENEGGPW